MRRLLVLLVLLGMFLGLRIVHTGGPDMAENLLLAAIGFVVLASFTAAELGSDIKLPRVTGYIAAGIVLGPSVANILSTEVVEQMTMFNTLALGLIAIGAGLELEVAAFWRIRTTLGTTTLATALLSFPLVFVTFVGVENWLHPLALVSEAQVYAIGLVLATLSIGTSPSVTMAIITELRARGRVADLTLGAAVVKDLVLVVLLAITTSICAGMLGLRESGSVASVVARELGGSVGVGALIGVAIIAYVRFVHAEMLLFVAALVLAVAELSRVLHLDLLLVFIAAGFVVRNFSKRADDVLHPLEMVALPVFVVFFTIAGARIDLQASWLLLPLGLTLASVRIASFYVGNQIGARIGQESSDVRSRAWLAYLPQAGVTLGLLGVAKQALPPITKSLGDIEIVIVGINLLLGPVTQRRALAPEAAAALPPSVVPSEEPAEGRISTVTSPDAARASEPQPAVQLAHTSLTDPTVKRELEMLCDELSARARELLRDDVRPGTAALTRELASVFGDEAPATRRQRLHQWAAQHAGSNVAVRAGEAARAMMTAFDQRLSRLPTELLLPMPDEAYALPAAAPFRLRARVMGARLRRGLSRKPRMRRVPLRAAARMALMPRLASLSLQLVGSWARSYAGVLDDLRRFAADELSQAATFEAVSERLERLDQNFRSDFEVALARGIEELVRIVRLVDTPHMPSASVRYSRVEPETRGYMEALSREPPNWLKVLSRAENALMLTTAIARVEAGVHAVLDKEVLMPLAEAGEALGPGAKAARKLLDRGVQALAAESLDREAFRALARELAEVGVVRGEESLVRSHFRAATALHAVAVELRQLVEALPEVLEVPQARTPAHRAAAPGDVTMRQVAPRLEAHRQLVLDFVPIVDTEGQRAASAVQDFDVRIGDALEMARHNIELALEQGGLPDRAQLESGLERAITHLEHGADDTQKTLIAVHDTMQKALENALLSLRALGGTVARAKVTEGEHHPLLAQLRGILDFFAEHGRTLTRNFSAAAERWGIRELWARGSSAGDPRELRRVFAQLTSQGDAPAAYARLFRLSPLRDRRLSVAYQEELAAVIAAEREWLRGGPGNVLIVGDPGQGKTSLLNLCQIELSAPRVIRPEPVRPRREVGVVQALSYEVGRRARREDLATALTAHRTAVLLDDLEQWFEPTIEGVRALRAFLDLVSKTRAQVAWIVTASPQFLEAWKDVVDVRGMFTTVVPMAPLDLATLARVIEARHAASGLELVHRHRLLRVPLGRFGHEARVSFGVLRTASRGNLAAALAAWPRYLRFEEDRVVVVPERLLQERLPSLELLEPLARAVLILVLRHGAMGVASIASALTLTRAEAERELVTLEGLALLRRRDSGLVDIVPALKGLLVSQLPGELS
jgi:Kef-type K+ transport system membrane component KefB